MNKYMFPCINPLCITHQHYHGRGNGGFCLLLSLLLLKHVMTLIGFDQFASGDTLSCLIGPLEEEISLDILPKFTELLWYC